MKNRYWIIIAVMGLMAFMLTQEVSATTVFHRSFAERLTHENTDSVVWGVVRDKTFYYGADNRIKTKITLQVTEVLKGRHKEIVDVIFEGGKLDDGSEIFIAGMPELEAGDEVFLLLIPHDVQEKRFAPLFGAWEGLYRFILDEQTGIKVACDHKGDPIVGYSPKNGELLSESRDKLIQQKKEIMDIASFIALAKSLLEENKKTGVNPSLNSAIPPSPSLFSRDGEPKANPMTGFSENQGVKK